MSRATTPLIPPSFRELTLPRARRITVTRQLGRGNSSTVFHGVVEGDWGVRQAVAVKIFDAISSEEGEPILETLSQAAQNAACVRHPNVVQLYDFGLVGRRQPFMTLELVEGRTLGEFVEALRQKGRRVPLDVALFIGLEVAEALEAGRLATGIEGEPLGLVHGELSPTDVLLSWNGEVKVGGFGLAAATRAASSIRSVRAIVGRIRMMAPEVARGRPADARSDVFSLGLLLREMLVGPRFAPGVTEQEALVRAREGAVDTDVCEPQLGPELRAILQRALHPDPQRRYAHAGALAYELRRVAYAMGVGDGRMFLRNALARVFAPVDDETTQPSGPAPLRKPAPPNNVIGRDRFAALRGAPANNDLDCPPRTAAGSITDEM